MAYPTVEPDCIRGLARRVAEIAAEPRSMDAGAMKMGRIAFRGALALAFTVFLALPARAAEPDTAGDAGGWRPVGISGGGSMFGPAISPVDPRLMIINCDMSGAYRSADGGRNWRMIHHAQLGGNTFCRPAFHPTEARTVFAASGWSGNLKVSRDAGVTWADIGNLPAGLKGEIAIDPGEPKMMLAGVRDEVWRSADGGLTWARCAGPKGAAAGFHFDQTSPSGRRRCFAATAEGVWRSDDGGANWAEKSAGLPWRGMRSFAGGSSAAGNVCALYGAVPSREQDGKFAGGVFRSTDGGEIWESAMGEGINKDVRAADPWAMGGIAEYRWVLATDAKPLTVYALNTNTGVKPPHHATVYRSDDGGRTWRATFTPDQRFGGLNVELDWRTAGAGQFYQEVPFGAAVCPSDPDRVVFCGSMGCYLTEDGGKSWRSGHTARAAGDAGKGPDSRWLCNGLVVTSTWHYYADPFEPRRRYIAYTDIGFARSTDAGASWMWWGPGRWAPWQNTCYELAFDPETRGRVWGAFSNVHDIPNDNVISGRHKADRPGGVCLSADFGTIWKPCGTGQPAAPATAVVLDPGSRAGARTLYAAFFDQGVYKSVDDGATWTKAGKGLGAPGNMRVCRLHRHPDGTLFALVTAKREGKRFIPEGPGLYRSTDGAAIWEPAGASRPLLWPKDFAVNPRDSRTIYVAAADAGAEKQGGLYRTSDGGKTWTLLARKGPEHFGVALHPRRPGWIYMTLCEGAPGSGLWLSRDDGASWAPFDDLPFRNIQRVEFVPGEESVIYVTTFGGSVWRGPEEPRGGGTVGGVNGEL
ncbi:MAG: hypothetical protein V1809_09730 [Planctomycetota bacterium]